MSDRLSTLLLNRTTVSRSCDAPSLIAALRRALTLPGFGSPVPVRTVRVPGGQGETLLHVFDSSSGALRALMDVTPLLVMQHALVGAIAADALALPEVKSVALLGATPEAAVRLKSLRLVRSLRQVRIYDEDAPRAALLAHRLFSSLQLPTHTTSTPAHAVADADVVIVSELRGPPLSLAWLPTTSHVQAGPERLSALSPELLSQARLFTDIRSDADATPRQATLLTEVLAGQAFPSPGASLFVSHDPSALDAVSAWHVLEAAEADDTLLRFDFRGGRTLSFSESSP